VQTFEEHHTATDLQLGGVLITHRHTPSQALDNFINEIRDLELPVGIRGRQRFTACQPDTVEHRASAVPIPVAGVVAEQEVGDVMIEFGPLDEIMIEPEKEPGSRERQVDLALPASRIAADESNGFGEAAVDLGPAGMRAEPSGKRAVRSSITRGRRPSRATAST
jgi:hypothetical protein